MGFKRLRKTGKEKFKKLNPQVAM